MTTRARKGYIITPQGAQGAQGAQGPQGEPGTVSPDTEIPFDQLAFLPPLVSDHGIINVYTKTHIGDIDNSDFTADFETALLI
jgi:hypothetical protein